MTATKPDNLCPNPGDDLELLIFQDLPPECWGYKHVPPHLVYAELGTEPRASHPGQALDQLSYSPSHVLAFLTHLGCESRNLPSFILLLLTYFEMCSPGYVVQASLTLKILLP